MAHKGKGDKNSCSGKSMPKGTDMPMFKPKGKGGKKPKPKKGKGGGY